MQIQNEQDPEVCAASFQNSLQAHILERLQDK